MRSMFSSVFKDFLFFLLKNLVLSFSEENIEKIYEKKLFFDLENLKNSKILKSGRISEWFSKMQRILNSECNILPRSLQWFFFQTIKMNWKKMLEEIFLNEIPQIMGMETLILRDFPLRLTGHLNSGNFSFLLLFWISKTLSKFVNFNSFPSSLSFHRKFKVEFWCKK